MKWYVVRTKPKQEVLALHNLKIQGFHVYYPQFEDDKTRNGKQLTVASPVFPQYMFVKLDTATERWRRICHTRGVASLLTATEQHITPLPDGFVDNLIRSADSRGFLPLKHSDKSIMQYAPGDSVRVTEGVFAGLSGTCERIKKRNVVVLLSLLCGTTKVEIPIELLRKQSHPA